MKKITNSNLLYWAIQLTWGLIMNIFGLVLCVVLLGTGKAHISAHKQAVCIETDGFPGGVSLGGFIFHRTGNINTRLHEYGHTLQNIMWGPLFLFVIGLPSIIRCGYYNYTAAHNRDKYNKLPDYDSAWFEGQATTLGTKYHN